MSKRNKYTQVARWNAADRQAFADCKLRAQTIPGRRNDGPEIDEWDEDEDFVLGPPIEAHLWLHGGVMLLDELLED